MRHHPNRDAPKGHPDRLALDKAEDIAAALDDARCDMGLSQRELALTLGYSDQYVSKTLNKPRNLALSTIFRFAHALGLEVRITVKPKKVNYAH